MDSQEDERSYSAFAGQRLIASGEVRAVVREIKACLAHGEADNILVFEDQTGQQVDFDLRGSVQDALQRLTHHPLFSSDQARGRLRLGPGRPRLGVVSREISLLPRHWTWLDRQPSGVSSTIRRLVDDARRRGQGNELARSARDAAGKFMWAMAGDLPHFEEASRALFAGDAKKLATLIRPWPVDIRKHVERLAGEAARLERDAKPSAASATADAPAATEA